MGFQDLSAREWAKAFGVGIVNGLLLSAIMVTAFKSGVSPLPKPVGLAFAETLAEHNRNVARWRKLRDSPGD